MIQGWSLNLWSAKSLTSTGALEEVGGSAYLNDCPNLREFPHIKYIGEDIIAPDELRKNLEQQIELNNSSILKRIWNYLTN